MKKALSLVAVLGLLSFVGCGGGGDGDGDGGSSSGSIVGTWLLVSENDRPMTPDMPQVTCVFNSDGSGSNIRVGYWSTPFTWSTDDNRLTITYEEEGDPPVSVLYNLSGSTLTVTFPFGALVYTRI